MKHNPEMWVQIWEVTSVVAPKCAVASLGHFLSKGPAMCERPGEWLES